MLEIDLLDDYHQLLKEKMKQRGVDAEGWSAQKCFIALFDNKSRQVPQQRYRVHISSELTEKLSAGVDYKEHLDTVIECFEEGRAIAPYLSTDIEKKPEKLDPFLIHWGLNHLHVVPPILREDGFYVRNPTRWLFFRVKGDDVYFVDVRPHKTLEMCDIELVAIMSRNWPELLAYTETIGEGEHLTPEQVRLMRKRKAGHFVTTEHGDVLQENMPTCSGYSVRAVREFDVLTDELQRWQEYLLANYSKHVPQEVNSLSLVDVEGSANWVVEGRVGGTLYRVTLEGSSEWRVLTSPYL